MGNPNCRKGSLTVFIISFYIHDSHVTGNRVSSDLPRRGEEVRDLILIRLSKVKAPFQVSEWLLFNTNSAIFQLYNVSWREQVNFQWDDDVFRFVLDQHAELDFYTCSASSLKQQSVDRHVAPLGHIILILSQPVFALTP